MAGDSIKLIFIVIIFLPVMDGACMSPGSVKGT
jgi:hypothetical protein